MINLDETALICDFAETYHVLDYKSLPLKTAAALSAGLGDNSRIKLTAAGSPVSQEILLLAAIADRVAYFQYAFTDDAAKKKNPPVSIVDSLYGKPETETPEATAFDTPDDFKAALEKIRRGG